MISLRSLMRSVKPVISVLIAMALALSLIGAMGTMHALAKATTFTNNIQIPYYTIVFVSCAAGGAGESVELSGTLHTLYKTTLDNKGGYHSKYHFQPQGVSGTGLTTGDKYMATGVTQDAFNGHVGSEETYVNNFRIIGQGTGNNFLVHETFHVTINANGEVTAYVDNFSVECK